MGQEDVGSDARVDWSRDSILDYLYLSEVPHYSLNYASPLKLSKSGVCDTLMLQYNVHALPCQLLNLHSGILRGRFIIIRLGTFAYLSTLDE